MFEGEKFLGLMVWIGDFEEVVFSYGKNIVLTFHTALDFGQFEPFFNESHSKLVLLSVLLNERLSFINVNNGDENLTTRFLERIQ